MERRRFLRAAASLYLGAASVAQASREDGARWRRYEVTTRVELPAIRQGARVWLPLPLSVDTDYFRAMGNAWTGDAQAMRIAHDEAQGVAMFVAEFSAAPRGVLELTSAVEMRDRAVDLSSPAARVAPLSDFDRALYTQGTELIAVDGIVRKAALEATQGAATDIEKARSIYEWIVDRCRREMNAPGCGTGDLWALLASGNLAGKCADLNALFVGMARSVGVPARDVYGMRVAPSHWGFRSMGATGNVTAAQHRRAEFHADSHGWVPVDPADVRKFIAEEPPGNLPMTEPRVAVVRERLFGAWEMNWMAFNYGHDLRLPGSEGGPVPFFMYPVAEVDGVRKSGLAPAGFKYTITSRRV